MFFEPTRVHLLSDKPEVRSSIHIPMVYDHVTPEPTRWEYHVLTVPVAEAALPDAEQLNALGRDGWILTNVLDERTGGSGKKVHYYFVRQFIV